MEKVDIINACLMFDGKYKYKYKYLFKLNKMNEWNVDFSGVKYVIF